jgi:release factor glutamine methyltransferase
LQREVRGHEPITALVAGADGLAVHERLLTESHHFLQGNGYLVLEIGFGQYPALAELVRASGWYIIEIIQDLQGIQRTIVLRPIGNR